MSFPLPTAKQARVLWLSLTGLAIGIMVALAGLLLWSFAWLINTLSSVLLPLAIAAIVSYLLDPVVDYLEQKKIPRTRGILLVFFLALMIVLMMLATVVPQLIVETTQLINSIPEYSHNLQHKLGEWLSKSPWGLKAKAAWDEQLGKSAQEWASKAFPVVSTWLLQQVTRVASWASLLAGFALIPVYTFYFLLEKQGILENWTDYLPLQESKIKEEVVFVVREINNCMIVFFRGQVIVAMCVGAMLTTGFLLIGLNYAVLLGIVAGALTIVPYLGVMISIVPAVVLAAVQFGDILHPGLVLLVYALSQMTDGFLISPKIIGDRVGLHPLTIIIAVMIGTTLLGGVLGGVLAIPLTAVLRTLMFRYVWKRRTPAAKAA